jgi:hypothetical protein
VPGLSYADPCGTCYANHAQQCEQRCVNFAADRKDRCRKPCLLQFCKSQCGYENSAVDTQSKSQLVDCDFCQRMNQQNCSAKCSGKDASCNKICISQACRSSCGLPAPPSAVLRSGDRKKDCSLCKTGAEQGCKSSCGSGPGSISCSLACIERKCEEACLID